VYQATVGQWVNDWGPLLTLSAGVLLAAITAWYAYLTKQIADSARTSAEQSRIAAEASLSSVAAAEASIDVHFDVESAGLDSKQRGELREALKKQETMLLRREAEINLRTREGIAKWRALLSITSLRAVTLTCRGATVSVHGFRFTYIDVAPDPPWPHRGSRLRLMLRPPYHRYYYDGLALLPTEALPRLFHAGETVHFKLQDWPLDKRPEEGRLIGFGGTVSYSFGNGPLRRREVTWTEPSTPAPIPEAS
jgi:hypothetical protein